MKKALIIMLFFVSSLVSAGQQSEVLQSLKSFHGLLISKEDKLDQYLHKKLSYGHSNGWVESRKEFLDNLTSGYTKYYAYKEDSITVAVEDKVAYARFKAEIDVAVNGKRGTYLLRILEIWVRQNRQWYLFARQAVKE